MLNYLFLFRTMSSFPPKRWDVRFTSDMNTLTVAFGSGGPNIKMEAFMAVKPASGEEGSFRFVLEGPEKISLKFNVQAVLPSGLFSSMVADAELHVGEHIKMQKNSCCSEWMDVAELVKSQDIRISNGLGEDVGEVFLHGWRATRRTSCRRPARQTGLASASGGCSGLWLAIGGSS